MHPSAYYVESIARGCRFKITRRLATRDPVDVWPELKQITIECKPFASRLGNIAMYELQVLCAVAKQMGARRLFEFGTFNGLTTWHLAANCGSAAQVFTLDLPLDHPARFANGRDHTVDTSNAIVLGEHFQSTLERVQVIQIYAESLAFDGTSYRGSFDFCFIDASHEYHHVCRDTENALAMVRPGGVIFWHDYSRWWPGVQRSLDDLSKTFPVFRVANTSLASLIVP